MIMTRFEIVSYSIFAQVFNHSPLSAHASGHVRSRRKVSAGQTQAMRCMLAAGIAANRTIE
jgi:hypothetical protein